MALFAYCGQVLVPVLLSSQSGATLGLSWVRSSVCQNCGHSKLQGVLPALSPERLFLVQVGPAVRPDVGPQPAAGTALELVRGYFPLCPGQESFWNGAGHCWVCL